MMDQQTFRVEVVCMLEGRVLQGSPKNNSLKLITMKERTKMNQFLECLKSQIGLYMPAQIKLSCEMCLSTISPETYGEIKDRTRFVELFINTRK